MTRAFLYTTIADLPWARAARRRALEAGIGSVTLFLDGDEFEQEGLHEVVAPLPDNGTYCRIFGTVAAKVMLGAYLEHSRPGDQIIRMEADTVILPPAARWLCPQPQEAAAHGYRLGGQKWCGLWSAPRESVAAALDAVGRFEPCRTCGGCLISAAFKATTGIRREWPAAGQFWEQGKRYAPNTHFLQAPHGLRGQPRADFLSAMHAHQTS